MNAQYNTRANWRKFLKDSPAELSAVAKAVIKQLGNYFPESLETLQNVSASPCGASGGFGGFIWYTETVKFWRDNRKKIIRLMEFQAEGIGYVNTLEMVQNFSSLRNDYSVDEMARALYGRHDDDLTQIYNTFAWYALEEVAYNWNEFLYNIKRG